MFNQEVTDQAGRVKVVVADNQTDLDAAVKAVKAQDVAVYPDINTPVEMGQDVMEMQADGSQTLGDGSANVEYPATADVVYTPATDPQVTEA